ncbi:General transcription factor II-I repeat domain-containing protein 2 [Thelohanellus kitauei]|uniref:General transcription factor II-I repeat domain-containing protein 2 n=1 Tax=Thelohanellus kitauei TaxID=669202 RepID=A0A0C2IJT7_THEKT|nr:General transcription factor II-I repeat domain-containing protein 2 [Thelohanellus kitauei]KII67324.1 General transcription factor II-I repeat domain-containing protein 2 [Thelohanellus kitauei]
MKEFNTKLQRNDIFCSRNVLKNEYIPRENKTVFFCTSIKIHNTHYKTGNYGTQIMPTEKYTNIIYTLDNEFTHRFGEFQKLSTEFDILSSPFTGDFENALGPLQLELIDLQFYSNVKEKFQSENIDNFYSSLNGSKFVNMRNMAMKLFFLLRSRYIFKQTFWTINKNKLRLI